VGETACLPAAGTPQAQSPCTSESDATRQGLGREEQGLEKRSRACPFRKTK